MAIWARIQRLNFKEIFILLQLFLPNPFYIFPTYHATRETMKLCDRLYGRKHYQDNRENAFRHAYWNFLIAEKIFHKNNSVEASLIWAKKINGQWIYITTKWDEISLAIILKEMPLNTFKI